MKNLELKEIDKEFNNSSSKFESLLEELQKENLKMQLKYHDLCTLVLVNEIKQQQKELEEIEKVLVEYGVSLDDIYKEKS